MSHSDKSWIESAVEQSVESVGVGPSVATEIECLEDRCEAKHQSQPEGFCKYVKASGDLIVK